MRSRLELAAVVCAAAVHFVLTWIVGVHGLDIAPIGVCCVAYACWCGRDPAARAAWGLHQSGLRPCARDAASLAAGGVVLCAAYGAWRGTLVVDLHLVLPLCFYPVWGLA